MPQKRCGHPLVASYMGGLAWWEERAQRASVLAEGGRILERIRILERGSSRLLFLFLCCRLKNGDFFFPFPGAFFFV